MTLLCRLSSDPAAAVSDLPECPCIVPDSSAMASNSGWSAIGTGDVAVAAASAISDGNRRPGASLAVTRVSCARTRNDRTSNDSCFSSWSVCRVAEAIWSSLVCVSATDWRAAISNIFLEIFLLPLYHPCPWMMIGVAEIMKEDSYCDSSATCPASPLRSSLSASLSLS